MTSVRPARPADAGAIARVHVAAWRAAYTGLVPPEELGARDVGAREALWTSLLDGRPVGGQPLPDRVLVADEPGAGPSGFLTLHHAARDPDLAREPVAEVAALYVDPQRWRRGTGSALLAAGLADAARVGADAVVLWVLAGNDAARAFYARHGFALDGWTRAAYGVEELRLRLGTL